MDPNCVRAALVLFLCCCENVNSQSNFFTVTNYGAVSDGETDNSNAFLNAWIDACQTDGGVVGVPPGTFQVSVANFQGPCNGQTFFQNMGTLKASSDSHGQDYWLLFQQVDGLTIHGSGTFDGNGPSAWSHDNRPASIKIAKVKNLNIVGITSLNSKKFHFHIILSDNVHINKVNIWAPGDSPNTDGIHLSRCSNVFITESRIATGDDCISLGSGCRGINIQSILCGPGHGISIGSLGKYVDEEDVTGVRVKSCTLINTTNGVRIKTWAPSTVATTVSDVTFEDIYLVNVKNPVLIDQFYCPKSHCSHQKDSDIKINGVKYINIRGTSTSKVALNLKCSGTRPCQNIEFVGIGITTNGGESTAVCSNAQMQFWGHDDKHLKLLSYGACSVRSSDLSGSTSTKQNWTIQTNNLLGFGRSPVHIKFALGFVFLFLNTLFM